MAAGWIDLVLSTAIWLTSAVRRLISAEMSESSSAASGAIGLVSKPAQQTSGYSLGNEA
jgi:hypothetical protein